MKYNEVAARVMHREGVIIDDLDRFALPQLAEIQVPADVHYTHRDMPCSPGKSSKASSQR